MLLHLPILFTIIASAVSSAQPQETIFQSPPPVPYSTEALTQQPHTGHELLDMLATAAAQRLRIPEAPIEPATHLRYYITSERADSNWNLENVSTKGENDMHDITDMQTREKTGGGFLTCKSSCTS